MQGRETSKKEGSGRFETYVSAEYSEQAEGCALGTMMLSTRAIKEVRSILVKDDFYVPAHQTIFDAVCWLDDHGKAVDFVTLKERLSDMSDGIHTAIDSVGGIDYLIQIAESVPSATNAAYYAAIVREKWALRAAASGSRKVFEMVREGTSSSEVASHLVSIAREIAGRSTGEKARMLKDVPIEGGDRGIKFGFPSIERGITCRGLPCGQVTVVKAKTSVGKTPMLTQMAINAARNGHRVCYATFADLTPTQWKRRVMKFLTGQVAPVTLESMTDWDEALKTVNDPYGEGSIMVYDGQSSREAGQIESFVPWLEAEHQNEPFGLVAVDYIQKVRTRDQKMSPFERVTVVGDELDQLAKRLGDACAMAIGSQVTTVGETNRSRYGTEVENDAGLLLEIIRELGAEATEIHIQKNRFGEPFKVTNVTFDKEHLVFVDPRLESGGK